jgi:hypothetical protein
MMNQTVSDHFQNSRPDQPDQNTPDNKVREAVAVFHDLEQLNSAVDALESSQFARHEISVLGDREKVEEKFGEKAVNPAWVQDSPRTPRSVSIRPEEKMIGAAALIGIPAYFGGSIAAVLANPADNIILLSSVALGSVAGAAIGGALALLIRYQWRKQIEKQIDKGGLLLWVQTLGPRREKLALGILRNYGGRNAHIHEIA